MTWFYQVHCDPNGRHMAAAFSDQGGHRSDLSDAEDVEGFNVLADTGTHSQV